MTTREAIRSLKSKIKQLAAEQRGAKASRKGCTFERMSGLWGEIWARSIRITAALNLYHALRDSAFKHGIKDVYLDERYTNEFSKEFAVETKA
jgi:hypothetical protein